MIARRDLLIGAACLAGAGAAYGLTPRRYQSLLGRDRLDQIVPRVFGGWTSRDVGDLVSATTDDDNAPSLYDETIERVYRRESTGDEIMMLMAHGKTQTADLIVHRPEDCYPAFGYDITSNVPAEAPLPAGSSVPARRLVAKAGERQECIFYWTRLGEYFPTDGKQERVDRLKTAMQGYIPDGVLVRFSSAAFDTAAAFSSIAQFIPELIKAVPGDKRIALIGTSRANAMAAVRA